MNGEIFECFRAPSMFFIHHDPSSRDSCKICSHHTLFILDSYRRRALVFKGSQHVARRSVSTIKGMTSGTRGSCYSRIFSSERIFIFLYTIKTRDEWNRGCNLYRAIFRCSCFRMEILNGDCFFILFLRAGAYRVINGNWIRNCKKKKYLTVFAVHSYLYGWKEIGISCKCKEIRPPYRLSYSLD